MSTIPNPDPGYKPAVEEFAVRPVAEGQRLPAAAHHPSAGKPTLPARAFAATLLLVISLGTALLAFSDPVDVLGGGGCPTRRIAGVYCPGCGSLRATHQLLHGHPALAWRFNPLLVAVGVPCAWMAFSCIATLVTGRPGLSLVARSPPTWLLWSAASLLIGWGVIRNIPLAALDWTRPPVPGYPKY